MMDLHPDDELLSALLDGEDESSAAHVEGCDACQARLDALRDVAEAVADPFEPGASIGREHRIAAAIEALRRGRLAPDGLPPRRPRADDDNVEHIAPRRPWTTRGLPLVAAAAALVVVFGVVTRLGSEQRRVGSGVGVSESGGNAALSDRAASTADDAAAPGLGDHLDAASLDHAIRTRAIARREAEGFASGADRQSSGSLGCASVAEQHVAGSSPAFAGTARLAGAPVEVYTYGRQGELRWFALSPSPGCEVVASD